MAAHDSPLYDVIVAGGGPVGLFLACELRLGGCSVLVLDQAGGSEPPLKRAPFGVRGLSVPTIESLSRRDLLEEIRARAATRATPGTAHWMKPGRQAGGHFAGIQFFHDQIDAGRWPYRGAGPVSNLATDMATIESVLAARADDSGVTVLRGRGVDGFDASDDDVGVRAGGQSYRSRWLVGCDGARSLVRKAAGIGFAGTEPEFTGYSVQVDLDRPDLLEPGRHYTAKGMYIFTPPGTIGMVDFDGGAFHRSSPLTRDHVEAVLRRVSGTDVAVTALALATSWTDRAFQAATYRKGRVLLAGDAAHIHSPLGGQGLNLGLADAMNLGWKLAAVVRGDTPIDLLDSYEGERAPEAARVLDWSRAQVALMRPSRSSRALEAIVRDLVATRDGATYFAERVWGVSIRYDVGCGHPAAGRSMPEFATSDGKAPDRLLRSGKGLLLDFDRDGSLQALANRWSGRVDYATVDVSARMGLAALLVRPDGIVAWASDGAPEPGVAGEALTRWFGRAADAATTPTRSGA